jgi:hypothetical protein
MDGFSMGKIARKKGVSEDVVYNVITRQKSWYWKYYYAIASQ